MLNWKSTLSSKAGLLVVMLFLCGINLIYAQVSIMPVPSGTEQFFLQQAIRVNIINTTNNSIRADLNFVIEDNQGTVILRVFKSDLLINSGTSFHEVALTSSGTSTFQFGNNLKSEALKSTGILPYGQYNVCYFLYNNKSNNLLGEYCDEKEIVPFAPPELIQPFNQEEINTTQPILSWKPPMPISEIPITYVLYLTELKPEQDIQEATERNRPYISRKITNETQLIYPMDALSLEEGKSYVWRVSAFVGDFNLGTTETWTFKVAKPQFDVTHDEVSYSMAKPNPDGNFYIAQKGRIYFAYDNRSNEEKLQYKITPINESNRGITLEGNLPEISLVEGMNKLVLDLSKAKNFKQGSPYILEIKNINQVSSYIEFIYKNE